MDQPTKARTLLNDEIYLTNLRFENPPRKKILDIVRHQITIRKFDDKARALKEHLKKEKNTHANCVWDAVDWESKQAVRFNKELKLKEEREKMALLVKRRESLRILLESEQRTFERKLYEIGYAIVEL